MGKSKEAVETNKDIEQLLLSIQKAFDVLVYFRVLLDKNFGAYHHQFSTRRLRLSVCHIC